jgi:hypothetical protein
VRGDPSDPGFAWWELLLVSGITAACLLMASWPVYALVLVPDAPLAGTAWPLPADATLHELAWLALGMTAVIWAKEVYGVIEIHHARITNGGLLDRRPVPSSESS